MIYSTVNVGQEGDSFMFPNLSLGQYFPFNRQTVITDRSANQLGQLKAYLTACAVTGPFCIQNLRKGKGFNPTIKFSVLP